MGDTNPIPPRPRALTLEMAQRAARKLAERLLKNGLIEGSVEDAAADVAKHGAAFMDGYELAKALDDRAYWSCDLQTAEALDDWRYFADAEVKAAQKEWAEANNIQPPLPNGARVIARWGGDDHYGTIDEVYKHGVAQYSVKADGEAGSRRLIVNFEDVRAEQGDRSNG